MDFTSSPEFVFGAVVGVLLGGVFSLVMDVLRRRAEKNRLLRARKLVMARGFYPARYMLRIPMKPAIDSETKPATCSDFIPASIPI